MAAAVSATSAGHQVTLLEASRTLGGRARTLAHGVSPNLPDGSQAQLDNGQHILIGAYRETLNLMRMVGLDPTRLLHRMPLALQLPDGSGFALPDRPAPWSLASGILGARGWSLGQKWTLLRALRRWQQSGFECDAGATVAELCTEIHPQVMDTFIAPLCVAALNTPVQQASAQVFLTVLFDALQAAPNALWPAADDGPTARTRKLSGTDLLLPKVDLSALFPAAAVAWLQSHGGTVRMGERAQAPRWQAGTWRLGEGVQEEVFDAVVWATSAPNALQALEAYVGDAPKNLALHLQRWLRPARALKFEAIATVYAHAKGLVLPTPMLALASSPLAPAQFVFDRGQLGGPQGLMAFVASACNGTRDEIEARVLTQAQAQLPHFLKGQPLVAVQTVVEKRATIACSPALTRPTQRIAPGFLACGDYLYAPYPSTLEGAVRSGLMAALALDELDGFSWKS